MSFFGLDEKGNGHARTLETGTQVFARWNSFSFSASIGSVLHLRTVPTSYWAGPATRNQPFSLPLGIRLIPDAGQTQAPSFGSILARKALAFQHRRGFPPWEWRSRPGRSSKNRMAAQRRRQRQHFQNLRFVAGFCWYRSVLELTTPVCPASECSSSVPLVQPVVQSFWLLWVVGKKALFRSRLASDEGHAPYCMSAHRDVR
jgi:hypothetical protein